MPELSSLIRELGVIEFTPLSETDVQSRLARIVTDVLAATLAQVGILYVGEEDRLRPIVSRGEGLAEIPCADPARSVDCAIPRHVWLTGKPLTLDDVRSIAHEAVSEWNLGQVCSALLLPMSLLAVPVRQGDGEVLGVLELLNARDDSGLTRSFPRHAAALAEALASQAGTAIVSANEAARARQSQFDTVFRLSAAVEYRDMETAAHIQRVSRYSAAIARGLGLGDEHVELARFASPMHDVGKIGVPDSILLKPDRLTEAEWSVMRRHTIMGAHILGGSQSAIVRTGEVVALTHHEHYDGTGYPLGLSGEDIPLFGRIVGLADAFDAITSRRCYKTAQPFARGLEIVRAAAGSHFDPKCVQSLLDTVEEIAKIYTQFADPDRDL